MPYSFLPLNRLAVPALILIGLGSSFLLAQALPPQEKKGIVKRARRPQFHQRDWETVFFKDIFKEGYVGKRPDSLGSSAQAIAQAGNPSNSASSSGDSPDLVKWSALVDRAILENEVKRLQIRLNTEVTTPLRYKTDHHKARITFSMLAMMFGVIENYDSDVRWKKFAPHAREAFLRAAANARTGSEQAYQNAKRQKQNLEDMVRGGNFPEDPKIEEFNWADVADRGAMMTILEDIYQEKLKPFSASQTEFRTNREEILHHASLVAALAEILSQEEMDDADDEGYLEYTVAMRDGALQMVAGAKAENYSIVETGVNAVGQSCTNCHDEWR